MKIIFDGNEWNVEDSTKNIVDIAKEHGIYIPAPCYYNKRENGCCNGCLILVNGQESRACETTPVDSMEIIYSTDELMKKRETNLTKFALGITEEDSHGCSCGGSCGSDDCSCGGNCSCGSH